MPKTIEQINHEAIYSFVSLCFGLFLYNYVWNLFLAGVATTKLSFWFLIAMLVWSLIFMFKYGINKIIPLIKIIHKGV